MRRHAESLRLTAIMDVPVHFLMRRLMQTAGSACYFFIIIFIRHEAAAAARWVLLLFIRILSNGAITVAGWTDFGFHVCSTLTTLNRGSRSIWMFKIKLSGQVATARRSATVFAFTGMPCSTSTLMSSR